jgi:excisionase family DNA binding protein
LLNRLFRLSFNTIVISVNVREQAGTNQWLKVVEVAELLQLPRTRTYELIHRGELPAVRVGERSIRVHRDELERFLLEERRVVVG